MPDFNHHYHHLIVGGGMTADAAVRGIRELDAEGSIGLLSTEAHLPYNRPPLSKGLWKGQPLSDIWRGTDEWGVTLHAERRATTIDPIRRTVTDHLGETYGYDKLLLATGGTPRRLSGRDDDVIYFRTLDDYHRLKELTSEPKRVTVIGAGYIGAEIAAALNMTGHEVHIVFPEAALLARLLPPDLANHVNSHYKSKGVKLHPTCSVRDVIKHEGGYKITTDDHDGTFLDVDLVVAGLGLIPNTELAETAGLTVGNGIYVNRFLRTSNDHIFAAGDVANFYDPVFERRVRSEHEDNANTMGQHAGRAMTGRLEPYRHLPFFYSDLFELGFEGVGRIDASMATVCDWSKPCQEGVVYYLGDGRVQGALMWNSWGKLEAARELIRSQRPVTAGTVPGLLQAV